MKFRGVGVNFGIASQMQYIQGLFQTREHSFKNTADLIKDGGETTVSKVYYDQYEEATFTYVVSSLNHNAFGTAAVFLPYLGQSCRIIDNRYPHIVGNWLVDEITTSSSNTSAMRVSVKLTRYPRLIPTL